MPLTLPRPAVLAALALLAGPAAARAADPPSLALHATRSTVTVGHSHGRASLDLGVFVTATGGSFELAVTRPDYDRPFRMAQVDSETGAVLRTPPADLLKGLEGLRRFLVVAFRSPDGELVVRKRYMFCPNSFDRQRLDDSGPLLPHYPDICSERFDRFPFTRGMTWGIDEGWAVNPLFTEFRQRTIRVPRGDYRVTVRIARRYRALFDVPDPDGTVTLDVTVGHVPHAHRAAARAAADQPAPADVPIVADPDPDTLPDLIALPAWDVHMDNSGGRAELRFASSPWNAGPAPMIVEGFRRPEQAVMDGFQYFVDATGAVVGRGEAGTFEYDARRGHNHWHFRQFAAFTLFDADDQRVVRAKKQAFCLFATNPVDLAVRRAAFDPFGDGLFSVCGRSTAIWVRESLPAGWADTYSRNTPGQSFDVTDVPNGDYRIGIEVNPLGLLQERSAANNLALRDVHLGGRPGARTVTVSPWHGITR